ncbi:MAG TPA: UDP-galactopyranose mutase [Myxococcales bacterium]|nr:UDP-galactopyranose mutase [Myxococcales bacterium]HAN30416.1 UDP-galactopyranose mutase [Myxococcales bacterium]
MSDRAIVVGAGIAGLSAALLLARRGSQVDIFEASEQLGGLLEPVLHDGIACDRGSHRVHPESHPLLMELTQEAQWQNKIRAGRLILNGRQLSYPLDPFRFVRGLGAQTTLAMAKGWLLRPRSFKRALRWESDRHHVVEDEGFESFVVRRVGSAAYSGFYEPYARKVWGIDPSGLSQTVAKQRVSTSNPLNSILKKTVRHFLYPEHGMAALIDLLRSKVEDAGVQIHVGRRFEREELGRAPVFYTGHLGSLVPDAKLSHRGLYLLHITVDAGSLDDTDTWYTPEARYWFGRVSQPGRFSAQLSRPGQQVICVEIPEGQWGPEQNFVDQIDEVMAQLHHASIVKGAVKPMSVQQTFIERVYPMYVRDWVVEQRRVLSEVAASGPVFPCGRQGLFLHCNMDHAVATAAAAVEHWQAGGTSEQWAVQCRQFANFRVRD